jgi:hypothetical protein
MVGMWVRSYKTADIVHGPYLGNTVFVWSQHGKVFLLSTDIKGSANWRIGKAAPQFPLGAMQQIDLLLGFGRISSQPPVAGSAITAINGRVLIRGGVWMWPRSKLMRPITGSGFIVPYWFLVFLSGAAVAAARFRWPPRISMRGLLAVVTFASILLGLVGWLDLGAPR